MPISGQGWELEVTRVTEQQKGAARRTVGTYRVFHDGAAATGTIQVEGRAVPLSGTTAESPGPSQNDHPATRANPSRIVARRYRLMTAGGPEYKTTGYRPDERIAHAMPGIELLDTHNRTDIIIHPGKNAFLSSIGCINLCTSLPNADEIIDYPGSRRRVIALIEDMKHFLGSVPASGDTPIPHAAIVIEELAPASAAASVSAAGAAAGAAAAAARLAARPLAAGIGWPLHHNVIRGRIRNNTFGMVRNGGTRPHQGWDFEAPVGTACFAIADGKVELVYTSPDYGKVAVLAFPFDRKRLFAAYAHLSQVAVSPGQSVARGDRIGLTGNTGNARKMVGPDQHLHFEIRDIARPGKGLADRRDPIEVFGSCPLSRAVDA
jgi:hypothetical protein